MVLLFISTLVIVVGLVGVALAKIAFEQWYQRPRCFDYARSEGIADIEYLRFEGVTIATNQYRGHDCTFIDIRTNTPVLVRFEAKAMPVSLDMVQVCVMVTPVLSCGLIGSVFWEKSSF
jgi:hypothetical protein